MSIDFSAVYGLSSGPPLGNVGRTVVTVAPSIFPRLVFRTGGFIGGSIDCEKPTCSPVLLNSQAAYVMYRGNGDGEPSSVTNWPVPSWLAAGHALAPNSISSASEALHCGRAEVSMTVPGA